MSRPPKLRILKTSVIRENGFVDHKAPMALYDLRFTLTYPSHHVKAEITGQEITI